VEITSGMRELTDNKTKHQNILFATPQKSKTISIPTYFRSLLPVEIAEFHNTNSLKYIKLTNKSSASALHIFHLSLLGEKEI